MPTTLWRASARLVILLLSVPLFLVGTTPPSDATTSSSPVPAVASTTSDQLPMAERFRAVREKREARELRLKRIRAHRELVQQRREARREKRLAALAASRGERIVAAAAAQAGKPYVYGATGPGGFDCSGLTGWAYRAVGIELPRTSSAQAAAAIPVSDPQLGDLVFFSSGGHVYHVAIYAGNGEIWHAPHPGDVVRKVPIWTSAVSYGRFG